MSAFGMMMPIYTSDHRHKWKSCAPLVIPLLLARAINDCLGLIYQAAALFPHCRPYHFTQHTQDGSGHFMFIMTVVIPTISAGYS